MIKDLKGEGYEVNQNLYITCKTLAYSYLSIYMHGGRSRGSCSEIFGKYCICNI